MILMVSLFLLFLSHILRFKTTKKVILSWLIISFFLMFLGSESELIYINIFYVFPFVLGFVLETLGKIVFLIFLIYFIVWR
jgi:hypothetical protein